MQLDSQVGAINDSLLYYGKAWGDELKVAVNTLDFTGLPSIRISMQEYIDRQTENVQEMDNIGGSEELLSTELEFLNTEKEIVSTRLAAFEQFTDSAKMDDLTTAYTAMQLSAVREQELLEKIVRLREQYAEKNNFPKFIEKY